MKKLIFVVLVLFVAFAAFAQGGKEAAAETPKAVESGTWTPAKEINFVVPYEVGGNSDIPARVFAEYMSKYSAVPVKVSNITGAGGRTGALEVQKANPDGYTVLMQPVAYPMQYALGVAKFSYENFEMVGRWLNSSLAIVVNADSPYQTLADLVAAAKAAPETIKMGAKTQTLPLFAAMYLESIEGIDFLQVDLDQKAPELLSKRIDAYIDGFGAVKDYVVSGSFRCLGIISSVDVPGFEYLPNFAELGYSGYEYLMQSFGMWAPKGTPKAACEYINNLIKQAATDPKCIAELENLGYAPTWLSLDDYTAVMAETYAKFQEEVGKIL
ncbi:MAG: tripartite tricarboxylate transporter substrate binding protein [Spirochaetales bacterium]|nr:tripartite tricarboxylate transporter substrate binding protein [Spirochaetales bacterium]